MNASPMHGGHRHPGCAGVPLGPVGCTAQHHTTTGEGEDACRCGGAAHACRCVRPCLLRPCSTWLLRKISANQHSVFVCLLRSTCASPSCAAWPPRPLRYAHMPARILLMHGLTSVLHSMPALHTTQRSTQSFASCWKSCTAADPRLLWRDTWRAAASLHARALQACSIPGQLSLNSSHSQVCGRSELLLFHPLILPR